MVKFRDENNNPGLYRTEKVAILANYMMSQDFESAILGARLYEMIGIGNRSSVKNRLLGNFKKNYPNTDEKQKKEIENFLKRNPEKKEIRLKSPTGHTKDSSFVGPLEKVLKTTSSIFLISSIFFITPLFTGNTIGNLTNNNSIGIGAGLFILGLVGLFIQFKK